MSLLITDLLQSLLTEHMIHARPRRSNEHWADLQKLSVRAGFLHLGIIHIWGRIVLVVVRGYPTCIIGRLAAPLASTH